MSDTMQTDRAPEPGATADSPHLGWALAGLSTGAGVIHFAMAPVHAANGWQEPFMFAAAGWFQLITAAMAMAGRTTRRFLTVVLVGNVAMIGAWAWSRIAGLPFGDAAGVAESVGAIDAAAVALEVGVVLVALRLLLAPEHRGVGRLAPALAAVAALGLATTVITSPDAAEHGHGASTEPTGLAALQQEIDDTRCDREFNPPSYWAEAEALGVDTYWAGNPPAVEGAAMSADGHAHGGAAAPAADGSTTTTAPDPTEGRGSPGLDQMVSATSLAATSEVEAARLISVLAEASDDDYDAWLWWLRTSGSLAHEHAGATASAEDGSGHGGHVGPQPWRAMTDPAQCAQLAEELELARATALKYPTAADAMAEGYVLTTGYLPGIAAHYIKRDLIDGTFEIDAPEMILYDGNGPEASVVGLSYYIWHAGDNRPTQGFTGDNDAAHRHQGLCSGPGGVIIGDTTTTEEECEARGGSKGDGSKGWMSHAWVVPGCESPWGVFSAASPILEDGLSAGSGESTGCAASSVRQRYGMGEPEEIAAAAPKTSSSSTDEGEASDDAPTGTVGN